MSLSTSIALAGAMFILAATPGPGVFATVSRSLASGFTHGLMVATGIVCGDLLFLLLAIYGLSSIADLLGSFFTLIKYAGGLYLLYLGLRIWNASAQKTTIRRVEKQSWAKNFSSGFMITLGNPKVILFYLGFLPTFLDLQHLDQNEIFSTAAIVTLMLGSVLTLYSYAAAKTRNLFASRRSIRYLNRGSGAIMMTTGACILTRK